MRMPLLMLGALMLGSGLVAGAMLLLDRDVPREEPPANPSPPAPVAEPEQPNECESLARLLMGKCTGFQPDTDRCAIFDEPFGDHGAGRTLHYGTGELWFVAPDGYVFADNDAARDLCPELPTVRDYDRSRARKSAERARDGDPTACSKADLRIADVIVDHVEVNVLHHHRQMGTNPTRGERDAAIADGVDRAIEELKLPRRNVEETWAKVRSICPNAL